MKLNLRTVSFLFSFFVASICLSPAASANGGGSSASASASAGAPVARLEPFVVNLASFDRYLQAILTLQVGGNEAADKIKLFMPMVRHVVIMTLSGKDQSEVQTSAGKKALIEELREKINKALGAHEGGGVNDIFFENFVIQ